VAATYVPYYEYTPSGATMKNALHYLNGDSNGTKITANVSSVTFGRMADYAGIVNTYTGVLADQEQEMPVYAYYVPNGDTNYDVYILSEGDIYAPVNCYELFYNGEAMASMTTVNLSNLNTSRTTNMARMFRNCSALTTADLRGLDTGAVTDMSYLFYKCTGLQSVNAAGLNTGNVTTMKAMFYECLTVKSLNLTAWNTCKVTNTNFMFIRCRGLEELIGSGALDFSSVTNMESMCEGWDSMVTVDVTNWGCDSATSMWQMFGWALKMEKIVGIENWNVSNVTNMRTLFYLSPNIKELDLSGWKTTSLQNTTNMFRGCTGLTTVYVADGWDMSNVTSSGSMFYGCDQLVGGQGTTVGAMKSYDATYAKVDGGAEAPGYLTYKAPETTNP
jgi:surface protein